MLHNFAYGNILYTKRLVFWYSLFLILVLIIQRGAAHRRRIELLGQFFAQRVIFIEIGRAAYHRPLEAAGNVLWIARLGVDARLTRHLPGLRLRAYWAS